MDDDLPEIVCDMCDFRFTVIWQNDYYRSALMRQGVQVVQFCPACGDELELTEDET